MNRTDQRIGYRWLIRMDMPEVLAIERQSYPDDCQWTEEDFIRALRERNCIGLIAEVDYEIVGFIIYALHKQHLTILNLAVAPHARRQGAGRYMVGRLIDKLSQQRRTELLTTVRETNLTAQVFFRAMGFRCCGVLRDEYLDTDEDAYRMVYRLDEPCQPVNRIKNFL